MIGENELVNAEMGEVRRSLMPFTVGEADRELVSIHHPGWGSAIELLGPNGQVTLDEIANAPVIDLTEYDITSYDAGAAAGRSVILDHATDVYRALGIEWGQDPFARIKDLEAQKDGAYSERNLVLALLAFVVKFLPFGSAWLGRHDENDANWDADWRNIVFIELPHYPNWGAIEVNQMSWHIHDSELALFALLPRGDKPWDGHTTEEKYERIRNYVGAK